jgi:putative transposase
MKIVERHIIKEGHKHYKECDALAFLSKNLYNRANYTIRKEFIENGNYLNYNAINKIMLETLDQDYRALPAKVSNGILRSLDKNWVSFFRSIKDWKKNPSKYLGRPKLPKYKHKESGRNTVFYEKGAISKRVLNKGGLIKLSKTNIEVPTRVSYEQLSAARIIARYGYYVLEVIYNKEEEGLKLNKDNVIGIDLGLNNLASVVSTGGDSFILNGKPLKSINQYFNKTKSRLQSKLRLDQFSSRRIKRLAYKRNNKINDYIHKASKYIIDYCLTNDIGKIVIGSNKSWKQGIKLGSRTNQSFVGIPFHLFIEKIRYKASLAGIEVITTEESYTSKCSFIDNEPLKKHGIYMGKRVSRGMFKSQDGLLINADINGAFNIIRKVVPLFNFSSLRYGIEGVAVHPLRISFS